MAPSRYKNVVDALAADIRSGRLPPATRLPTHRALAATHKLALATASRIYAQLGAMGLVTGEIGRGTFVRDQTYVRAQVMALPAATAGSIDLTFSDPSLPGQAELLREALRKLAASGDLDTVLHYLPHGGRMHERAIVARFLRARGLKVPAAQVLIVNGAQHGLAVSAMGLLNPGDIVAVDALTYPGFRGLARVLKLELLPLAISAEGPDLDALELVCRKRAVRAVYSMPTLHNPLGCVMSTAARRRLIAIARLYDLLIIEDAAYAYLDADAPAPLAAMAPERTVYVSSLSKNVATGLRFGFVVAPVTMVGPIEAAIQMTVWNMAGILASVACSWIEDGTVARLEAEKRRDASERQAIATRSLTGLKLIRNPQSYLVWLPLGEDQRGDRVKAALAQRGVSVSTADSFATTMHVPHALRLALGSVTKEALKSALSIVRQVVETDSS